MRSRTSRATSTYVSVVISPATTTSPVVISVSQATRLWGSSARHASRTASEIWSAILSGWPSVTDSDVNRNERALIGAPRLADVQEEPHRAFLEGSRHGVDDGAERIEVRAHVRRQRLVAERRQRLDETERLLEIDPVRHVLDLEHERDLGDAQAGPHPEHALLVEERGDVLERDAEHALHVLELEAGAGGEVAELLRQLQAPVLAVPVEERERVGGNLFEQIAVVRALELDVLVEEVRDEARAVLLRLERGCERHRLAGEHRQGAGAAPRETPPRPGP